MHKLTAYSIVFVGFLLLFSGLLYAVSSYNQLSVNALLYRLENTGDLSEADLDNLIEKAESVEKWLPSGNSLQNLSIAEFSRGMQHKLLSKEREDLFVSARQHVTESLSKSPANPYSWLRLAYLNMVLENDFNETAKDVYMSVLTGPYERDLIFYRIRLASIVWSYFNDEQKYLMKAQILAAWELDNKKVFSILDTENSKTILLESIKNCPKCVEKYKKL